MTYPRASMPLTPAVLQMANDRAERWRKRCEQARAEVERLEAIIESKEHK